MPVSAIASSTQLRPSATLRTRSATLAFFRELTCIAQQIQKNLLKPHGIGLERANVLLGFNDQPVLILLGKLSRGADDLVDESRQIYRFGIELQLAGLDLREIQHLVDEAKEMGPGGAIAVLGYLIVPLLKISRSSDDPLSRIWALVLVFLLVCVGSDLLDGSNFV
jgi:hypothetical protein